MIQTIVSLSLWFAAIGAGLMAGVYFAFSAFVMTALARMPKAEGIAAMQSINRVILRSTFMPLFFATTVASLALAIVALFRWDQAGAAAMFAGGITYVVGMFLCTVVFNVPLNNALDEIDPASAEAGAVWAHYLRVWTRWNHVRTVACTLACALFIAAIVTSTRSAEGAPSAILTSTMLPAGLAVRRRDRKKRGEDDPPHAPPLLHGDGRREDACCLRNTSPLFLNLGIVLGP